MTWLSGLWHRLLHMFGYDHSGPEARDPDRRKVLAGTATIGALVAAAPLLPKTWTTPVLRSIVVPAHAATTVVTTTTTTAKGSTTTTRRGGTTRPPPTTATPATSTTPLVTTTQAPA